VAAGAGLPTRALITDMDQVLGTTAGNALEMREAIDFLTGRQREPRLLAVTLALAAQMMELAGLAPNLAEAERRAQQALDNGAAAERFARMVSGLGGPKNVLSPRFAGLARAPVVIDVAAPRHGFVAAMDTRAIGLAVIGLGGGRVRAADTIDQAVGLSDVRAIGTRMQKGDPICRVHARAPADALAARERVLAAVKIDGQAPTLATPVKWASAPG
jgi:thymidine phosphorylase